MAAANGCFMKNSGTETPPSWLGREAPILSLIITSYTRACQVCDYALHDDESAHLCRACDGSAVWTARARRVTSIQCSAIRALIRTREFLQIVEARMSRKKTILTIRAADHLFH